VLHVKHLGEVSERSESFGFGLGKGLQQIAKDKFERIVFFLRTAAERQRIGECAATATTELADNPAQEQGIAAGLLIDMNAVGLAGPLEQRLIGFQFGEQGERSFLLQFAQANDARVHIGASAAGDDGLAARRKLAQELEELVLLLLRERLDVVENEQSMGRLERVYDGAGTVSLRLLCQLQLVQLTRDLVKHVEIAGHHELGELALTLGSHHPFF
jgi:hypothetical protein